MIIMGIDPGPEQSAWCIVNDGKVVEYRKSTNDNLVERLHDYGGHVAIEMIASYGMPVGAEVFDTCVWIGRYIQVLRGRSYTLLKRKEIGMHLCNSTRANDSTVRQALIDKFGGKDKAIGKKKTPGPLYGVTGDVWSALALAVTWSEMRGAK